jgi:hypothetical protein
MCVCVYLMLLPVHAFVFIGRRLERGKEPTESLRLLPATRCSAVCHSFVRVPSWSITRLLPDISVPEGLLLTTNLFPTCTLLSCVISGEIFSIFFQDNHRFSPSSYSDWGQLLLLLTLRKNTFSACLEMQLWFSFPVTHCSVFFSLDRKHLNHY